MREPTTLKVDLSGGTTPPESTLADDAFLAASSRRMEIAIAVAALLLSIVALALSRNISLRMGAGGIDPRWWPSVLSIGAALLSGALLTYASFAPPAARDDVERALPIGWARVTTALALTMLYVFAWSKVGYLLPTALFLVAILWTFGLRRWLPLVLYPVVTTGFIYGLFHLLLRVPL